MTSDDDRIRYLGADPSGAGLDEADRAGIDDVRALLGDPALWDEPSDGLEDAVVAAVAGAAGEAGRHVARRDRRRSLVVLSATAAVIAVVIAVAALVGVGDRGGSRAEFAATLTPTELAPSGRGTATFTQTDSGWRIELDAPDLKRLDRGRFYQAWLRGRGGDLVAVGTFNEGRHVTLWAGVSPADHPTITVTEEAADGNAASSGRRVLTGSVTRR
jgi:hypothetical protein